MYSTACSDRCSIAAIICFSMAAIIGVCFLLRLLHASCMIYSRIELRRVVHWLCGEPMFDDERRVRKLNVVALHIVSVMVPAVQLLNALNLATVPVDDPQRYGRTYFAHIEINCFTGLFATGLLYIWLLLREKCLRDNAGGLIRWTRQVKISTVLVVLQWVIILADLILVLTIHTPFCRGRQFQGWPDNFFDQVSFFGLIAFGMLELPANALVIYAFLFHFRGMEIETVESITQRTAVVTATYLVSWTAFWGWWFMLPWQGSCMWSANMCPIGRILSCWNFMQASLSIAISHRDDLTIRRAFSSIYVYLFNPAQKARADSGLESGEIDNGRPSKATSVSMSYESSRFSDDLSASQHRRSSRLSSFADIINQNFVSEFPEASMPPIESHNPITDGAAGAGAAGT